MVNLPQCERAERVRDYVTIRVLIQELEELGAKERGIGNPNERLQQLKLSCRVLAGLGGEDSPPENQAYSEAREALHALRSQFGSEKS